MVYAIRSPRVGTPDFLAEVRDAVWAAYPTRPLGGMITMDVLQKDSMARTSFTLVMLAIAAAVALLLGSIGIFGVISYTVSQRTQELGLRKAMGAEAGSVAGLVVRQGLGLAVVGVGAGIVVAMGVTRLMASLLFGVGPMDPLTYASGGSGPAGRGSPGQLSAGAKSRTGGSHGGAEGGVGLGGAYPASLSPASSKRAKSPTFDVASSAPATMAVAAMMQSWKLPRRRPVRLNRPAAAVASSVPTGTCLWAIRRASISSVSSRGPQRNSPHVKVEMATGRRSCSHFRSLVDSLDPGTSARMRKLVSR